MSSQSSLGKGATLKTELIPGTVSTATCAARESSTAHRRARLVPMPSRNSDQCSLRQLKAGTNCANRHYGDGQPTLLARFSIEAPGLLRQLSWRI